ncbi:MAG: twitching motility protein PilT [Porticoccaceae bacterium]|nr:MAG: twitching motility protein PilT [Porticoccaceae bacterium]
MDEEQTVSGGEAAGEERGPEALLAPLLGLVVEKRASDLFLYTGARPTLKGPFGFAAVGRALRPGETAALLAAMLSERKMAEFEAAGEVDFSFSVGGLGRFRGNAFRQRGDVSIVMRYVSGEVPTIDGLGLPPILKSLVEGKNGLIVVSGATGSGKSTTLAAMIDHRNANLPGNIITLEDPIEYLHSHKKSLVAQREVGTDTLSFESGMRAAMREAPDVILMGEIRDAVSMEYALRFANTGHLCLSTLHANTAASSLERMLSFFDRETEEQEAKRLAQNLRAIICQRLVPTESGGKTAALEILVNTTRIAELIARRDWDAIRAAVEEGRNYGMQTFDQCLCELYDRGVISAEVACDHATSRTQVQQYIRFKSPRAGRPGGAFGEFEIERIEEGRRTDAGTDSF